MADIKNKNTTKKVDSKQSDNKLETKPKTNSTKSSKTNKKDNSTKEKSTFVLDTKKLIIKNKNKLIITLIAFPFGFLFALQNRKKPYTLGIIYLLATLISILLYVLIYNFFYYRAA